VSSPQYTFELGAVETLLRLAVGGTALGVQELLSRAQKWEEQVMYNPHRASSMPVETPEVRTRYALIGLLFLATRSTRDAAVGFANYSERQASSLYRTINDFSRTPLIGLLASPLKVGVDAVLRTRDRELERWIRIGRLEERDGRRIAALGTEELIKEVVDAISKNPTIKNSISDLVQQQSLDLAGEMVDDVRQSSINADDRIEGFIWRLLGRAPRQRDIDATTR
jgi:hypothetical protein